VVETDYQPTPVAGRYSIAVLGCLAFSVLANAQGTCRGDGENLEDCVAYTGPKNEPEQDRYKWSCPGRLRMVSGESCVTNIPGYTRVDSRDDFPNVNQVAFAHCALGHDGRPQVGWGAFTLEQDGHVIDYYVSKASDNNVMHLCRAFQPHRQPPPPPPPTLADRDCVENIHISTTTSSGTSTRPPLHRALFQ